MLRNQCFRKCRLTCLSLDLSEIGIAWSLVNLPEAILDFISITNRLPLTLFYSVALSLFLFLVHVSWKRKHDKDRILKILNVGTHADVTE